MGDIQVEIFEQHNDRPSSYLDLLKSGREGFHHVSSWLTRAEYDSAMKRLIAAGTPIVQEGMETAVNLRFAYFETDTVPGSFIYEDVGHQGFDDLSDDADDRKGGPGNGTGEIPYANCRFPADQRPKHGADRCARLCMRARAPVKTCERHTRWRKNMIVGKHHVAISTPDLERLHAFYRDVMGLETVFEMKWEPGEIEVADKITGLKGSSARAVMMRCGNAYVELFQYRTPKPRMSDPDRPVCDHGITHLCLDVKDLDAEYARLSALGMRFHCSPQIVGEGCRTTYGRDPDGNVVELQELATEDHPIVIPSFARA
jgi:catechol 2,3-dioxygenase-like lactoylglutathione lyase family enzyme